MNQKIILGGATGNFLQGPVEMNISSKRRYLEMLLAMIPGNGQGSSNFYGPLIIANLGVETKDFSTFYFELNELRLELDPGLNINFPKTSGALSSAKAAMVLTADGTIRIRSPGVDWVPFRFDISSRIISGTVDQFTLSVQNDIAKSWIITPKLGIVPLSTVRFFYKIQLFEPQCRLSVSGNLEHQTGVLAFGGTDLKLFKNDDAEHTGVLDVSRIEVKTEFDGDFKRPEYLKHIQFNLLVDKIAFQQNKIEMNTASLDASSNFDFALINSNIVLGSAGARIKSRSIHLKQKNGTADIRFCRGYVREFSWILIYPCRLIRVFN